MTTTLERFFAAVVARRRAVLALWCVSIAVCVPFIARVQRDFSVEAYFPKDDPARAAYERFAAVFPGEDATVAAFVDVDGAVSVDDVAVATAVAAQFTAAGLTEVRHLGNVTVTVASGQSVGVGRLVPDGADDATIAAAATRAAADPLLRGILISADQRMLAVLGVAVDDSEAARAALDDRLTAALTALPEGARVHLSGLPILRARYLKLLALDQAIYVGVAVLLCFGLLYAFYRSVRATFAVLLAVVPAYAVVLAGLGVLSRPLTALTSVVPVILLVVGLSDSTHLLVESRRRMFGGATRRDALASTFAELAIPCLATAVTTAIGFFALVATGIDIVVDFGVVAGLGILVMWAANMVFVPALLAFFPDRAAKQGVGERARFKDAVDIALVASRMYPKRIVAGAAVLTVLAAIALPLLHVNTRMIDERDDHALVKDIRAAEAHGFGLFQVNVFLEMQPGHSASERPVRAWMAGLEAALPTLLPPSKLVPPTILGGVSLFDHVEHGFVAAFPGESSLSATGELFESGIAEALAAGAEHTRAVFDPKSGHGQVIVFVRDQGSAHQARVLQALSAYVSAHPPPSSTASVTGTVVLAQGTFDRLVSGFLRSLAWATGLIFVVLLLQFRSLRFAMLGLVPNALPLLWVVGVVAALGLPLSPTLVLAISIATGLVVDDTIHLHTRIRGLRGEGASWRVATDRALRERGPAVLQTATVITGAFAALTLSQFAATFVMGVLLALSMAVGVGVELLVFPAVVHLFAPDRREGDPQ